MKVLNSSYNVLTIDIGTVTASTDVTVGTALDYRAIKRCTGKSGVIRVKAKIGVNVMFGTCEVNPWADGSKLECTCLTNFGGSLQAVVATVWEADGACKANVTVTAIGD